MTDYNSGLLPEPCLRLDYGGSDIASIELGDGTCYVKADGVVKNLLQMPIDIEALKAYSIAVRGLLVEAYKIAGMYWKESPKGSVEIEYAKRMDCLWHKMAELGIEVE